MLPYDLYEGQLGTNLSSAIPAIDIQHDNDNGGYWLVFRPIVLHRHIAHHAAVRTFDKPKMCISKGVP